MLSRVMNVIAPPDTEMDEHARDAIRAELQRVLNSPQFDASERNRRFLVYAVEETLAGRAGRIKAYNVATEVFGRDVNFDPQLDPVVRMEARRLRRSLERFYLIDGPAQPFRIAMPKGGYVPEFLESPVLEPTTGSRMTAELGSPLSMRRAASLVVASFDAEGDESAFRHFSRGLTDQLLVGLSRFPEILVFGPGTLSARAELSNDGGEHNRPPPDFILSGSAALFGNVINVKAVLTDGRSDRVIWGRTFERTIRADSMLGARDEIANRIVSNLAQSHGVILSTVAKQAEPKNPDSVSPLEAIARFCKYRLTYGRTLYFDAMECLDRSLVGTLDSAEIHACLSHLQADGARFGFGPRDGSTAMLQQALALAKRAVELDPESSRAHHALGMAQWLAQDVQAAVKTIRAGLVLNTNAVDVRCDLGLLYCLSGQWEAALPLLQDAPLHGPQLPAQNIGLSLYHFAHGRYEEALDHAGEIHTPDIPHGYALRATCLLRLGRRAEAAQEAANLLRLPSCTGGGVMYAIRGGHADPALLAKLAAALREAGLPPEFIRN
jgi:adenylate cyclase